MLQRSSMFHGYPLSTFGNLPKTLEMFGKVCIAFGKHSVNLQKFANTEILKVAPIVSGWVEVAQKSCLTCKTLRKRKRN